METRPKKICFVGAPSTGKSTLAKLLAEELIKNNHSAKLVGEYAREFIIKHGAIDGPQDQVNIYRGQKEKEAIACSGNPEFVVCDVPTFISQVYFDFLKDKIKDKNKHEEMERGSKELLRETSGETSSYDFVFFLPPELAPEEDGVRLYTEDIGEISSRIQEFLHSQNIKYQELRGTLKNRIAKAYETIFSKTA